MRVLLVTGEYPPDCGGVADYTRELARALVDLGVQVGVLSTQTSFPSGLPFPLPFREGGEGVRSRRAGGLPTAHRPPPTPTSDPWPVFRAVRSWGLRGLAELRRRVLSEAYDLVHIQYQTAAYGMGVGINLLPRVLRDRRRTVVTMHDLRVPFLFPKAGPLRALANRTLVAGVDAAILTNEADFAAAEKWRRDGRYLVPIGSNIAVGPPHGYDREAFRRDLGLGPDELLVGYFGLLNSSKGVETLLDAVAQVRAHGIAARLALIGDEVGAADPTNAASRGAVLAQIGRLGLESAVTRTGRLPAPMVSAHLLALDLCVLPFRDGASFRRGSLMAALAHGLPIVTTHPTGGSPSALRDEEEALLVRPDDPAALAGAIARALTTPALRKKIAGGAARLAERFTWPAIARQTIQVYQELA